MGTQGSPKGDVLNCGWSVTPRGFCGWPHFHTFPIKCNVGIRTLQEAICQSYSTALIRTKNDPSEWTLSRVLTYQTMFRRWKAVLLCLVPLVVPGMQNGAGDEHLTYPVLKCVELARQSKSQHPKWICYGTWLISVARFPLYLGKPPGCFFWRIDAFGFLGYLAVVMKHLGVSVNLASWGAPCKQIN